MRARAAVPLLAAVLATGCVENPAPGNDREAELEPPAPPAQVASPAEVLSGVSVALVMPETMSDADQGALPDVGASCRFHMTEVGFPVAVYGSRAAMKLNGKLVSLPGEAEGRYGAAGISVTFRPLADAAEGEGTYPAEMVLRLPGAPNELGFHGFATCS